MNYIANPLSRNNIRKLTKIFREVVGVSEYEKFPILGFIEFFLGKVGYSFEILEDYELKGKYAEALPDEKRLLIRQGTYEGAVKGNPRDLFTLAHEIGHLFLHNNQTISFARKDSKIKCYEDPEWQANTFAAELFAPADIIISMTQEEVVNRYGCSWQVASIQLNCAQKIATGGL